MTPERWELSGKPGDVIVLGVMRINVFAASEQDIRVGGLSLPEWSAKVGRSYVVHPLEGRVCVTIEVVAGDRIAIREDAFPFWPIAGEMLAEDKDE